MTDVQTIDPLTIKVGQRALFTCVIEGCTYKFWHTWLPMDASGGGFGNCHCYLHGIDRPVMVVTAVVNEDE